MSKKILVLSASPRKGGNSDLLCDQFMKAAQEAGHITEKIRFQDVKINYCTGSGVCFEKIHMPAMNEAYEIGKSI